MATYNVKAPDGTTIPVTVADTASEYEVFLEAEKQWKAKQKPPEEVPPTRAKVQDSSPKYERPEVFGAAEKDYTHGAGPAQLFAAGIGGELEGLFGGMGRLGADMFGSPETVASFDQAAQDRGASMRDLRQTKPGALGSFTGNFALGATTPIGRAGSVLRGMAKNAATFGPIGGLQAYGMGANEGDAIRSGLVSGGGAAAASGALDTGAKGLNALMGRWEDPAKQYVRDFARQKGVDLRIGDLYPKSMVRKAENVADRMGVSSLDDQTGQLEGALFGQGNAVLDAMGRVDKKISDLNVKLWEPVYKAASQPGHTLVRPVGLYQNLRTVVDEYPQVLSKIENQKVRRTLEDIVSSGGGRNLPGLSFREARDLEQAIGPELAAMKLQLQNGSVTQGQVNAMRSLYKSVANDLKRWGNAGQNQRTYDLYQDVNKAFKKDILPYMKNDFTVRYKKDQYSGHPEKLIGDILRPTNRTQRENLLWYMSQLDHEGTGLLETMKAADRAGRALRTDAPEGGASVFGAAMAPKAMAGASAVGHGSQYALPMYAASRQLLPNPYSASVSRGISGGTGLSFDDIMSGGL